MSTPIDTDKLAKVMLWSIAGTVGTILLSTFVYGGLFLAGTTAVFIMEKL